MQEIIVFGAWGFLKSSCNGYRDCGPHSGGSSKPKIEVTLLDKELLYMSWDLAETSKVPVNPRSGFVTTGR